MCVSDSIDMGSMEHLLHNVCLLLASRTREIVKAALSFIKVILFVMDPKTLAGHVTVMVGLCACGLCWVSASVCVA